ncbi:MAG: histidine triad nucleotide-binding protein [Candidatus Melainabacteria bacterium]|nr:MAG: histidine triad nucleotide-binding protein [Candidatus Melainabacteria bacterium]
MSNECIFCKIVNGEIPSKKVYENDYVIAFDDINPKAKIHTLVVPKEHIESFNELEDEKLMAEILKAIKEVVKIKGIKSYKLHVNTGKEEGQIVMHLHFHILSNTVERI